MHGAVHSIEFGVSRDAVLLLSHPLNPVHHVKPAGVALQIFVNLQQDSARNDGMHNPHFESCPCSLRSSFYNGSNNTAAVHEESKLELPWNEMLRGKLLALLRTSTSSSSALKEDCPTHVALPMDKKFLWHSHAPCAQGHTSASIIILTSKTALTGFCSATFAEQV